MDLQTRKTNFIQDFLKLESEKTIAEFEKLLKKETLNKSEFKQMSINEFHARIEMSSKDSKNEKVSDVEDLLSEIEKWS
jgi:hypothetical protein